MRFKTLCLAFSFAGMLSSAACTDAGETLIILRNSAVDGECTVTASGTTSVASGVLDTAAATEVGAGYILTPIVQSRAAQATTGMEQGTNITFITGANVDLSAGNGDAIAGDSSGFFVPLSGSISPGGTLGLAFEVVPPDTAATLLSGGTELIQARVKLLGEIDGGSVESQEFSYPISLCSGCSTVSVGACSDLAADFSPTQSINPCNPAQDSVTQCCTNSGGALVCPAAPEIVLE